MRSSFGGHVPHEYLEFQFVQELGIQPSELDAMAEWRFHLWHQFMLMGRRTAKIMAARDAQRDELAALLQT